MKQMKSLFLMCLVAVLAVFTSCESENDLNLNENTLVTEQQSIILDNVTYYYSVERNITTNEEFLIEDETTKLIQDFFKTNESYSTYVESRTGFVKYYTDYKTMSTAEIKNPESSQSIGDLNNTRNTNDDLVLYQDSNFGGTKKCVNPQQSSYVALSFNDKLSSFVLKDGPTFNIGVNLPVSRSVPFFTIWENTNFNGRSLTFVDYTHFYNGYPAQMRIPNLNMRMGGFLSPRWNDQVSSSEITYDSCAFSPPGAPPFCPTLTLITTPPPTIDCSTGGSSSGGGSGGGGSGSGGGGGGGDPGEDDEILNQITQ